MVVRSDAAEFQLVKLENVLNPELAAA